MATFDLANPAPNPGDALRDEAANLLSARFGRCITEYRVNGKKSDIYFTKQEFGKINRIYVEVKDHTKHLNREDVVHIWSDYSGIVEKNKPSSLLIITRYGLTPDAQAYVNDERPEMHHQTIWELENDILGLTEYIRSLSAIFDEEGLSSYYVEGQARQAIYNGDHRDLKEEKTTIFNEIQKWIESLDKKPIAILGGYGAGKSSLAKRLIANQANIALGNPESRRPVLIKLGVLSRYSSLEGLLGGMFTSEFPVSGFTTHTFLTLNQKGRLLVILDGFDEMKHAMSWGDFRAQIKDLNRLTGDNSKVILLGRPSAFTSLEEHSHVLRGMKRWENSWVRLPDWPEFTEYDLEEFTASERVQFFRGYLRHRINRDNLSLDEKWISTRVNEVERLASLEPELFGKPVHAKILIDLAANPAVSLEKFSSGITRWSLYEIFFNSLAEREVEKPARRPIGEQQRLEFIQEVAFWLWTKKGGATSFSASDLSTDIFDGLSEGEAADQESLKREYLTGSFLEKKSGDIYYFGHRSFAEFLVANRMIKKEPWGHSQSIYSYLVRDGVLEFLRDAPEQRVFINWAAKIPTAQSIIHLEYLDFLSQTIGGIEELKKIMADKKHLQQFVSIFEDRIELKKNITGKILSMMKSENNDLFFILLSLFQIQVASDIGKSQPIDSIKYSSMIAGVILERLFMKSKFDAQSHKVIVDPAGDDARSLAQNVIGSMSEEFHNRVLFFKGKILLQEKDERLRRSFDISTHPPITVWAPNNEPLPWEKILSFMSPEGQKLARNYFSRSRDLRDIFTKDVRPPPRNKQHRPMSK